MARILIVDDDRDQLENVQDWLEHENYVVETAASSVRAEELLKAFSYDLLILDWNMPAMTGVELLRRYRAAGGQAPVMMLTGMETAEDKEEGLDSGADDYLTKPFIFKELSARVRALLRRPQRSLGTTLRAGDIEMDPAARRVTRGGKEIELLPKEYSLLEFLLRHPGQLFDAEMILDRVWSSEQQVGPETVKTTIMRLRKKIDDGRVDSIITSVRGVGYKIEAH